MKVIIDEDVSLKKKLTIEETLVALAYDRTRLDEVTDNLISRGVLEKTESGIRVAPQWKDTLDFILATSEQDINKRLENLAIKIRGCFPEGQNRLVGVPYYYRSNVREVIKKLEEFFKLYGDYADEDIINATKKFIASFRGNYKYCPQTKFFILKNKIDPSDDGGPGHFVKVSPLATLLENKDSEDLESAGDDWLTTVRN